MVYRGRPGKGCVECRQKKTRCDAARPSCGQCKRAGRICSGYRDLDALRMVDQTSDITKKVSRSKTFSKRDSEVGLLSPDSGYAGSNSPSASSTSSQEDLLEAITGVRSFTNPYFWASHEASFIFFDQFISVVSQHPKTELDFVALLYNDVASDGMLASIVSALGFIALPSHMRTRSLMLLANEKYLSAVRQTQKALQDPKKASSDETLATVLLLGLHEFVDLEEPQNNTSRLSVHLDGSIKLLQLRGDSGMEKMSGTRMFHRICSHVVLGSMHRRQRIPPALLDFGRRMQKNNHFHREELLALDLVDIATRLCNILASTTIVEPAEVVSQYLMLVSLDQELEDWSQRISFRYRCGSKPFPEGVSHKNSPLRHRDIYFNHIAASCVNRYRSVRIVVNEEIIRLAEIMPSAMIAAGIDISHQCRVAMAQIAELSEEIAHSLPFFFGEEACQAQSQGDTAVKPRACMHAAAVTLMPIYYACNSKRVSPEMFQWLMRYLQWIGNVVGIGRANTLHRERQLLEDIG